MYNNCTTVDLGSSKTPQHYQGGPFSARSDMSEKENQVRMGRPPRLEGSMTEEQFQGAIKGSKASQKNLDAAHKVLVGGESTDSIAKLNEISRQYLYRVMNALWDRLNGIEEVTERLPTKAAQMVRELAEAYRLGGADADKKLQEIQQMTAQLKKAAEAISGVKKTLN